MSILSLLLGSGSVKAPTGFWTSKLTGSSIGAPTPGTELMVAVDASGNTFVASPHGTNTMLTKLSVNGVIQWQFYCYQMYPAAVCVDASGNVYLAGNEYNTANANPVVYKLDTTGAIVWNSCFGNTLGSATIITNMVIDTSGNLYISGEFQAAGYSTGTRDAIVIKLNSSGTYVSRIHITTATLDRGLGLGIDPSGNVYMLCVLAGLPCLMKLNSSLAVQLTLKSSIAVLGNSGYAAAYSATGHVYWSSTKHVLTKTTAAGTLVWARALHIYNQTIFGIAVDAAGAYVYVLSSATSDSGGIIINKLDSAGNAVWQYLITLTGQGAGEYGLHAHTICVSSLAVTLILQGATTGAVYIVKIPVVASAVGTYGGFTIAAYANEVAADTATYAASSYTLTNTYPIATQTNPLSANANVSGGLLFTNTLTVI